MKRSEAKILKAILHNGPMCRSELAKRLAIPASAVTEHTSAMIEAGMISECGFGKNPGRGRKHVLLDVNISYAFALGAGVYEDTLSVGLCTLKGDSLEHLSVKIPAGASAASISLLICDKAKEIMKNCCITPDRLLGAGICAEQNSGLAGAADRESKIPVFFEPADEYIAYSGAYLPISPQSMYKFGCARVIREILSGNVEK